MEENNDNFSVDTEQLKNETKDTVNQVRETIKNTDFKEEAVQTKGFLLDMFLKPIETVKRVASGEENVLSKSIMIMILFIVASVATRLVTLFRYGSIRNLGDNLLSIIGAAVNPLLIVLVISILILLLNRKNPKSMITVISTVVIAYVPRVIRQVVSILVAFTSKISTVTTPIVTMLTALTYVLMYFGIKGLFEEDDENEVIKKYAIIILVAEFILAVIDKVF